MPTSKETQKTQGSKRQPKAKAGYEVPKGEENTVHAEIELLNYTRDGQKMSTPFVQKYNPRAWENFLRHRHGYTINKVLHAPDGVTIPDDVKQK